MHVLRRGFFVFLVFLGVGGLSPPAWTEGLEAPARTELQQLLDQADPFLQELSKLRGLPFEGHLQKVIRSREEIGLAFREELAKGFPRERLQGIQKALAHFGLIPPTFDLEAFLLDFFRKQAAAYYDPEKKELVFADWVPPPLQRMAVIHELAHILQDQALGLETFLDPKTMDIDEVLARRAIIEGEATALTLDLLLAPRGLDITTFVNLTTLGPLDQSEVLQEFAGAPQFLLDLLLFPYIGGTTFVQEFRRRHPWPAFSEVYTHLPRSTHAILYPKAYLDGHPEPPPVMLPANLSALEGWRSMTEEVLGAFALNALLEPVIGKQEAKGLVQGWAGDRYRLYERGERRLLLLKTRWTDARDAEAFFDAFSKLIEQRYPTVTRSKPEGEGRRLWRRNGEVFVVERRDLEVLVLEGVPPEAFQAAEEAMWGGRTPQGR
ncbi:MAG: hypothetical protein HY347_12825 [candidate division NC10 bacterium]|nr:hypothetical protein [candidate division NC10 bacterium]